MLIEATKVRTICELTDTLAQTLESVADIVTSSQFGGEDKNAPAPMSLALTAIGAMLHAEHELKKALAVIEAAKAINQMPVAE